MDYLSHHRLVGYYILTFRETGEPGSIFLGVVHSSLRINATRRRTRLENVSNLPPFRFNYTTLFSSTQTRTPVV